LIELKSHNIVYFISEYKSGGATCVKLLTSIRSGACVRASATVS